MGSFTKDNEIQSTTTSDIPDPLSEFFEATLDEAELYKLHHWLKGIKGSSIFEAHGFLCALTTSPVRTPPTTYFPAMLRPDLPKIISEDDLNIHMKLLMRFHNQVGNNLAHDEVFYPLINFQELKDSEEPNPFEGGQLSQEQRSHLQSWCKGYLAAVDLELDAWAELKNFENLFLSLRMLVEKHPSPELFLCSFDLDMTAGQINNLLNSLSKSLPILLAMTYDQACRVTIDHEKKNKKQGETDINILSMHEQNKRSALCYCGSDKPFIQCCAQQPNTVH